MTEQSLQSATIRCLCCGHTTLHERAAWEICAICNWEDDGQDDPHAAEVRGGPNGDLSLAEARENFQDHRTIYRLGPESRGHGNAAGQTAPVPTARDYVVRAASTDTFGRVICSARTQHFVVDGPVQNGCPGEALTPAEVFLSGVASCGVELMQVIAHEENIPLRRVSMHTHGVVDRANQARDDVTLFTKVLVACRLEGTDPTRARRLVDGFKRRCPLFGTLSVATPNLTVLSEVAD